jgi:hypothetical protein
MLDNVKNRKKEMTFRAELALPNRLFRFEDLLISDFRSTPTSSVRKVFPGDSSSPIAARSAILSLMPAASGGNAGASLASGKFEGL